jgi:erythromycin esterase-like protein
MPDSTVDIVRRAARPFLSTADGVDALVGAIGDARVVLIGDCTHGTHELYRVRAELTKALIERRGFNIIAVEADWPDAYRVNRWVRGASDERGPETALDDFTRFPRWMWRNRDVVEFIAWLRTGNEQRPVAERTGFYGLDLYSLHRSIEAVLTYLDKVDPGAAERARSRYACFDIYGEDPQAYGYQTTLGLSRPCEDEVTRELMELRHQAMDYASRDGRVAADEYFFAEQNARLVANAENYYRAMFQSRGNSWNLRDQHMMETLDALLNHVTRGDEPSRAVVWAHNSHLGDARATQMSMTGELNLGQLVREKFGDAAFLIGTTTHTGSVTAVQNWGDPAQRRRVRPSMEQSYERLFHDVGWERFLLVLRDAPVREALQATRLERAIGVIYRPDTERASHYFRARLPEQFDAVIHIDETHALEPLETWAHDEVDLPETFPYGV